MNRLLYGLIMLLMSAHTLSEGLQPNSLWYHVDAKPGDKIPVKLTLFNERDVPEKIELKPVDYSCNAKGEHFYEESTDCTRSSAKWIELSTQRVEIPPKGQAEIVYTIQVPHHQDLHGTYWNVILIEPTDPLPAASEKKEDQFQLLVKIRYAYHVVVTIGKGDPSLKILTKDLEEKDGKQLYSLDVANNGDFFLNPKLTLKAYNDKGRLIDTFSDQEQRIYPGCSVRYTLDISKLKPDHYTGFLLLDNGDKHLFGDRFEFTISKDPKT